MAEITHSDDGLARCSYRTVHQAIRRNMWGDV
jgi:hypothetical protein